MSQKVKWRHDTFLTHVKTKTKNKNKKTKTKNDLVFFLRKDFNINNRSNMPMLENRGAMSKPTEENRTNARQHRATHFFFFKLCIDACAKLNWTIIKKNIIVVKKKRTLGKRLILWHLFAACSKRHRHWGVIVFFFLEIRSHGIVIGIFFLLENKFENQMSFRPPRGVSLVLLFFFFLPQCCARPLPSKGILWGSSVLAREIGVPKGSTACGSQSK